MHKKHMYATRETNSSIYDVNMPVLLVLIIISTDAEAIFSDNDFGIVILLFKRPSKGYKRHATRP